MSIEPGKPASEKSLNFLSKTTVTVEEDVITYTWVIENFLLITEKVLLSKNKTASFERGINSECFSTAHALDQKCTWNLILWPCLTSQSKTTGEKVGVYVKGNPGEAKYNSRFSEVSCCVSILDFYGKKALPQTVKCVETSNWSSKTYLTISRGTLLEKKDSLLPGGVLTVVCELYLKYKYVLKNTPTRSMPNFESMHGLQAVKLASDMKILFGKQRQSDVTISCNDGTQFKVHKIILSARSPVFAKMFESKMIESQSYIVNIQDIEGPAMKKLLKYIYCIKFSISPAICYQLYYAADKYELDNLKELCAAVFITHMDDSNVLDIAAFADTHSDSALFNVAKAFVRTNSSLLLSKSLIDFIQKSPDLANRLIEPF